MKTILFIDESEADLWSLLHKYDFLFDELRRKEWISVCKWHKGGTDVASTVPDLSGLVMPDEEWQAVVVTDLRQTNEQLREDIHYDNPFDFEENYFFNAHDSFVESGVALIRLTQMLGGLPEKAYIKWPGSKNEVPELSGYEVAFAGKQSNFDLIERYRLGILEPSRIICLTPRDVDDAFFEAKKYDAGTQNQALDNGTDLKQPSKENFWQRNGYPPSARFIVFDRRAKANAASLACPLPLCADDDWFKLCVCIIAVATGTIHAIDLRPYELYRISVDIDETELVASFAQRRAEWEAAKRAIEERCEIDNVRLRASEYRMANLPNTKTLIPVAFDLVKAADLSTDPKQVKFVKDCPKTDISVWLMQKRRIMDNFTELLRAPRRALRNAAGKFREQVPFSEQELEYCIINEYEKDKLIEELHVTEYELAKNVGAAPFEAKYYSADVKKKDAIIVDEIEKRATLPQTIFALVVGCAALFVGFLPYIFGACGGVGSNLSALAMSILCCVLLAFVCLVTLLFMRKRLRESYVNFGKMVHDIYNNLTEEAKRLEEKISKYATFKKRWAIYDRQLHMDIPTTEVSRLEYRRALLQARIDDMDEIIAKCHDGGATQNVIVPERNWDQISRLIEDATFYELGGIKTRTSASDESQESFGDVPYSFIENVELKVLRVQ